MEEVAERFFRAMLADDRETARGLALTHAQFTAFSNKAMTEAEFDERLEEFLDARAREGREADPSKGSVVGVRVKERRSLKAAENEKLKRDTEIAVVQPLVRRGDVVRATFPFPFILTPQGWRFTFGP